MIQLSPNLEESAAPLNKQEMAWIADLRLWWIGGMVIYFLGNVVVSVLEHLFHFWDRSFDILIALVVVAWANGGAYWLFRFTAWRWLANRSTAMRIRFSGLIVTGIGIYPIYFLATHLIGIKILAMAVLLYGSMLLSPIIGAAPLGIFYFFWRRVRSSDGVR